jgi:4-oxalomesaconate tautomerase
MPAVVMAAAAFGLSGEERPEKMEADGALRARVEAIRLQAGPRMGLGDVAGASVPKMVLVSPPRAGGAFSTRCFIPHRVHAGVGVLAAVSAATACRTRDSAVAHLAEMPADGRVVVEHPSGATEVFLRVEDGQVTGAGTIRTARKLFDGFVFA